MFENTSETDRQKKNDFKRKRLQNYTRMALAST